MAEPNESLEVLAGKEPPMLLPDGKRNPDHLRWQVRVVNRLSVEVALGRVEKMPAGYNLSQAKDLIETEARLCGMDPRHLMDVRTDAQIYADATDSLIRAPSELFAQSDEVLAEMERQMDRADTLLVDECGASGKNVRDKREAADYAKKAWGERIKRLRRLRERARDAFPSGNSRGNQPAIEAAHVLRFMIYVGRDVDGGVLMIGPHHGAAALALYEAENGRRWENLKWIDYEQEGVMFVFPPGTGKTTYAAHRFGLRIAQRPTIRILHGHAKAGEAEKNLEYVGSMFDTETAQGRRLRSLFPNIPATRKLIKGVFDLEPIGGEKKRQPTMVAHGIMAKVSGADADEIWFDDPCDQDLATQETTRVLVFDRMNGTWRARKREKGVGKKSKTFEFTTTTLWHHDDPNARRVQLAREGKIRLRVKILACGGPEDGFKSIWPEMYPPAKLRQIYQGMRNPSLYAAAYQCNPQPESLRKVKRLAYYDPTCDAHKKFLDSAIFHVSLDPAATNHDKSDMASFVYGGCGDIVTTDGQSMRYERRLRIIYGREFHATQSEGVAEVCAFSEMHSTHYIHTEAVAGFEATREFFEERGLDVIAHQPHGKSKSVRLGHVATMFDDSLRDKGFPGAVVEFPGKRREDGTLGPDTDSPLRWLEDQILNFGVARGDHGVDALVYLAKHLGPELNVAEGAATKQIQMMSARGDPRINRMLDFFARGKDERKTAAQEDHDFMTGTESEAW